MASTSEAIAEEQPQAASVASLAVDWLNATRSRVKLTTELALAEAKLAALSIAAMALVAMLAAVFVLGAWGLLVAGAVYGLVQTGVPLWATLVTLGVIHVAGAVLLWRYALGLSRHLNFQATRQQFRGKDDDDEENADAVGAATASR